MAATDFADPFPAEFEAHFTRRPLRLPDPYPDGPPAPRDACSTCTYSPCACSTTDAAVETALEAVHFGDDLGFDQGCNE